MKFFKIFLILLLVLSSINTKSEERLCKKAPETSSPQIFWTYFRDEILNNRENIKCLPISKVLIQKGELDDEIIKLSGDKRFIAISTIIDMDTGLGNSDSSNGTSKKLSQLDLIRQTPILTEKNNPSPDFIGIGNMTFRLKNKSWKLEVIYK